MLKPLKISLETKDKYAPNDNLWKLPINNDVLSKLQWEDVFCKNILSQIKKEIEFEFINICIAQNVHTYFNALYSNITW